MVTIPIGIGGLDIRRVSSLALPAFLESTPGTLALESDICRQLNRNRTHMCVIWKRDSEVN